MMRAKALLEKTLQGFTPTTDGACWEWRWGKDRDGYGQITHRGRSYRAHRAVYELVYGPHSAGRCLDHLRRNRACVNPQHLEPVTPRQNCLRGQGRAARNVRKTHCKHGHAFTEENTYAYVNERYPHGRRVCKTCVQERAGYTGPESAHA